MYKKIILICGMPRSGTSWLGQIFDSSKDVAFRMEPLFSYRFKNVIDERSSTREILSFFEEVYLADDDFMNQTDNRKKGAYSSFEKVKEPKCLVVKTTRHHDMLRRYLEVVPNIEVVSIVRHPCAAISSWINADREFRLKGCKVEDDWRSGICRKDGPGEYWGFRDWLAITKLHVELEKSHQNFSIVRYEDLVDNPISEIEKLFGSVSLEIEESTLGFLHDCQSTHNADPYSVFKNAAVKDQWETLLAPEISREIIEKVESSGVEAVSGVMNFSASHDSSC